VANQGDTGRLTKAERKEQARLERERIEKQMRVRHRNRSIGLSLMAVALVTIVVVFFVIKPGTSAGGDLPATADLLSQAKSAATTSGCTPVKDVGFYDGISDSASPVYDDQAHIGSDPRFETMPALRSYPSIPPASGPHNQVPLPGGVYNSPPAIDQAIHSLEHAGAIVWYAPDAPKDVIDQIKAFYKGSSDAGLSKVIVAPYDYGARDLGGQLPAGTEMALVAWHMVQTCTLPSLPVAFNFTSQYSNGATVQKYIGVAPEPNNTM
jgi:hypothetical protein